MTFKTVLLSLSALSGLAFSSAFAQDSSTESGTEVVVTGRRVSDATLAVGTNRATATVAITREALLSAPAGITGLKMLEGLPGFNVQANDALGMYEFGNSVSVRAFNFQQIGFVLDGVPTGRSDQFGGSPIYRYVDNENLLRVEASAGAGDIGLPSYSSLGPVVSYFTKRPDKAAGGVISQTFGSDALSRTFARVESGEHGGFSGYVAGSWIKGDLWRGPGTIDRSHIEGKARYAFETGDVTFTTVHNDYFDYDSPAVTLAQYNGTAGDVFGRKGRDFAYLGYVPKPGAFGSTPSADNLPASSATAPAYSNALYNQYYKFAVNSRQDHLYALTLNNRISETFSVSATAYYEDKRGYGVSPEAYATSLTSHNAQVAIVPGLTAPKGTQYGLSTVDGTREGFLVRGDWRLGNHDISAGLWLETDDYHRTQARYNTEAGHPDGQPLLNEPVHRQRDYISTRETAQYFVKDTIHLLEDRLKVELGFKGTDIHYTIKGYRNPADYINRRQPELRANWQDSLLPQVGAVWSLNRRDQVFASYSENLALPRGADDIFSLASPLTPAPDAETAKNWELGYRANHETFNASFVVYSTQFDNRLQSYAAPVPGSTTTETFFQNVGAVEAKGAEFSGLWKPNALGGKVYFSSNLSYNVSEFKNNFSTFTIAGNRVPDFPEWVFQGGVTFEPVSWAVFNLSARHITERFTNFTNTESIDGYTLLNLYADIGDTYAIGPLKNVKLRVNVDNLTDEDYLGTINPVVSGPATFRQGPPRTVQLTLSAAF